MTLVVTLKIAIWLVLAGFVGGMFAAATGRELPRIGSREFFVDLAATAGDLVFFVVLYFILSGAL